MPSVYESTRSEDVPTLCPHMANLMNADITRSQKSSSVNVNTVTVAGGHWLSDGERDCLKVQDESYCESGENSESELENREASADQRKWIRPDLPSRCTWRLGAPVSESPHGHPAR